MVEAFFPREYYRSVYDIPFERLYARGVRGIMFDIDNTLAFHGAPADRKVLDLFSRLHGMGLETCLISNNKESRVKPFAGQVGSPYVFKSGKPFIRAYVRGMARMGTDLRSTVFVGDQLFTDIYGANRAGVYSILVKPMNPREEIQIVLKRYLEKPVLWSYLRKGGRCLP